MSKKIEEIRCSGCGALIQTEDINNPGYIDKEVLLKHKEGDFYCKRCFDLKHYNKNITFDMVKTEYIKNLDEIRKDKGLIVYIVDLFDLDGTIIKDINTLLKTENILLVVNKVDLFLDSLNRNKLYNYVKTYFKEEGIIIKDALLISALNEEDIDTLVDKICEMKKDDQNVYFVGMTNVGKSTILNKIIKKYHDIDDLITVSNNVNTTLSNIYIPFNEKSYFVDTPGILNKESLIYYLDKASYKYITPKSYIKPKTFQINNNQSLFIAGFLKIDVIEGNKISLITNFNNNMLIHRTKLENSDAFYEEHKDDILKYPNKEEREKLGKLKSDFISFDKNNKIDLVIFGIGFISIYGIGKIKVTSFENIKWKTRKAII